jgi:hypothetical protein
LAYYNFCKWSFRWVQHYRSKQLQFLTFPCRHTAVVSCCFGIPPQLNMNQFYCLCREWRRPDCTFRNWCCIMAENHQLIVLVQSAKLFQRRFFNIGHDHMWHRYSVTVKVDLGQLWFTLNKDQSGAEFRNFSKLIFSDFDKTFFYIYIFVNDHLDECSIAVSEKIF